MSDYRHIDVSVNGIVTVVRFRDHKILDTMVIERLAHELNDVAAQEECKNMLLNLTGVGFLSSSALGKLLILNKTLKAKGGKLRMCHVASEIIEVFKLTKLDKLIEIKDDETNGLLAFYPK